MLRDEIMAKGRSLPQRKSTLTAYNLLFLSETTIYLDIKCESQLYVQNG